MGPAKAFGLSQLGWLVRSYMRSVARRENFSAARTFWMEKQINVVSRLLYGNLLYLAASTPGPKTSIFGRTDLRISLSGAKFDPEADFDVRFAVARQNSRQISKKRNF